MDIYDQGQVRSEHREHTWKISMNRYGYVRKEMDTLSGVRAYMVKMYLQVEMYTIFDDFIQINESGVETGILYVNMYSS
jgi:hypothetical protein